MPRLVKMVILSFDQKIQYMKHLTREQRYTIWILKKEKHTKKIAKLIGINESIINTTILP